MRSPNGNYSWKNVLLEYFISTQEGDLIDKLSGQAQNVHDRQQNEATYSLGKSLWLR